MKPIALLSALTAALGAYLLYSGIGATKWIGLAVFLTGTAIFLLAVCASIKQQKTIDELHEQLTDFLAEETKPPNTVQGTTPSPRLENEKYIPMLVGSIPPGESKTGTASCRVESEKLGKVAGKLLLSYEDEYGEYYEQEIPLSTTIEEKKEAPLPQNSDATQDVFTQQRRLILAVAGAIFIALICYFAIKWRKEKKEREIDEMRL